MMTPRGVSDVNVYTPERVEARYGIRPDQIPDFIGLKGDTSDNIPGVPGIGDKTAGQLVAQYGSLEGVLEHVEELSPARKKNLTEFADQARAAKVLATMRRDLDIDADPAELVLAPPDRAQLRETFRQFEFRALLGRVDELDEAVPARERISAGTAVRWREEASNTVLLSQELLGIAAGRGPGRPRARRRGRRLAAARAVSRATFVAHDAKALRVEATDDTMILAYLIDPARSEYLLDDLAAEYAVEAVAEPEAEEETARLVRHAAVTAAPARPAARARARARRRAALPRRRAAAHPASSLEWRRPACVSTPTGWARSRPASPTASRSSRQARYELAGEEFVLGSPQQLGRILFEKLELTPGRKGKTGYSTDTKVLRSIRAEHEIVAVIEEWRELSKLLNTYLVPLPDDDRGGRAPAHDLQPGRRRDRPPLDDSNPNLQSIPIRTELGREIRSAFVAEQGARLISADYSQIELRILAHVSGEPKLREAFERGEDIHTATAAEVLGVDPGEADPGGAVDREDDQLRDRLRDLGLRPLREPRDPARAGAGVHRRLPRALPARAGLHPAHDRAGRARRLRDEPARAAAAGPRAARAEPRRRAASASASRSTS